MRARWLALAALVALPLLARLAVAAPPAVKVTAKALAPLPGGIRHVELTATRKGIRSTGRVAVVVPPKAPAMVVYVFPGHTPQGDPYLQKPQQVVQRMGLVGRAARHNALFVVPEMGETVYEQSYGPATKVYWDGRKGIPGGLWANDVLPAYVRQAFPAAAAKPFFALGISTGAEGAFKFGLAHAATVRGVVGLSGTYDLLGLHPRDGEYEIHAVVLGPRDKFRRDWAREDVAGRAPRANFPLAAYAEAQSGLTVQTQDLLARVPGMAGGVDLVPDSKHNWDFWGHPAVVGRVFSHLEAWRHLSRGPIG